MTQHGAELTDAGYARRMIPQGANWPEFGDSGLHWQWGSPTGSMPFPSCFPPGLQSTPVGPKTAAYRAENRPTVTSSLQEEKRQLDCAFQGKEARLSEEQESGYASTSDHSKLQVSNTPSPKPSTPQPDSSTSSRPSTPYMMIIADSILASHNKMLQLQEIYDFFEQKHPYFREAKNKSWKNAIRHNLSLNECFQKAGRGANGKGNFWRVHPAVEGLLMNRDERRKLKRKRIRLEIQNYNAHQQSMVRPTGNGMWPSPLNAPRPSNVPQHLPPPGSHFWSGTPYGSSVEQPPYYAAPPPGAHQWFLF